LIFSGNALSATNCYRAFNQFKNNYTDYFSTPLEACKSLVAVNDASDPFRFFTGGDVGIYPGDAFEYYVPNAYGDTCFYGVTQRIFPRVNIVNQFSHIESSGENCLTTTPTLIGYFNGVVNTRLTANDSLDRLRREYGVTYKTKSLVYDLFYNQTTCELGTFSVGKIPCLEDIAEVFEQRTSELNSGLKNRWEHFWEMLGGRTSQDGSLTATLTSKLGKFGEAILQMLDNIYTLVINQFVGSFFSLLNSLNGTPTLADNAVHVVKLKTYADKGSGMVLIAHSQGNLFVNAAYDGIKAAAPAAKVQVVHIAPASPTLRGGYALADVDFVIRSLRQLVSGLPSVNIELPLSANDRTGHSFEGTYLDITRNAYARVKALITSALDGV
jgi:hypothetical protein